FSADLENPQYHLEITREAGEESRVFTSGSVRLQVENSPTEVKKTCETPEGTLETSLEEGVEKAEFSGVNRKHVENVCERARARMKQKIAKVKNIAADLGLIPDLEISRINETKEEAVVRNSGESTVNLAGWTLSDGSDNVFRFGSVSLAPGETVTVYSSEKLDQENCEESSGPDYERCWDNSYVWNNDGETATLTNARGDTSDSLTYE
ncbi:MAG: lamin tail domain-containing protein, partial [Candidatus Nanohaloarchaea archaeon]